MSNEIIRILGVYRVPFTKDLLKNACELKYGDDIPKADKPKIEELLREELSNIVLIELMIENVETTPDLTSFHQTGSDQAAYDEHYFSEDGEEVIGDFCCEPPKTDHYRVGFFLHFYDASKPLETSWGPINLPEMVELPNRLAKLMPYSPVD
jgi:hypothetical protein